MVRKNNSRKGKVSRSAGRFGVRYGRKDRKLVADLEANKSGVSLILSGEFTRE